MSSNLREICNMLLIEGQLVALLLDSANAISQQNETQSVKQTAFSGVDTPVILTTWRSSCTGDGVWLTLFLLLASPLGEGGRLCVFK
jgi:hypothetical protein